MNPVTEFKLWFDDHYEDLEAKCTCPEERAVLVAAYQSARDASYRATNRILNEGNRQVEELVSQLDATRAQLDRAIERQENLAAILNMLSTGVAVVAKLTMVLPLPSVLR